MAKNGVTVLEIGSSKINILTGTRGINANFNIFSTTEASYAGFADGQLLEEETFGETLTRAISNAEENAGFAFKEIYIGLPAEFCRCSCKTITSNFVSRKRITDEILETHYAKAYEESENETMISCSDIYNVLDDGRRVVSSLDMKTSKITSMVSVIYAQTSIINLINNSLKNIGIERVTYLCSPLCCASYILKPENYNSAAMLIDIGYITTSVAVVKGQGLMLLNSFSLGGGHIMGDLAQCLNIDYQLAEQLKRKIVLSLKPANDECYEITHAAAVKKVPISIANEIVTARLDMIASCISKCINVYTKQNPDHLPIFLTGGGIGLMKGGKDYLSKYIGKNIELVAPPVPELDKPQYSSILGLFDYALKDCEKNRKSFLAKIFKK